MYLDHSQSRVVSYIFEDEDGQVRVTLYEGREENPIGLGAWRLIGIDVARREGFGAEWSPPMRIITYEAPGTPPPLPSQPLPPHKD